MKDSESLFHRTKVRFTGYVVMFACCRTECNTNLNGLQTVRVLVIQGIQSVILRFLVFGFAWSFPGTEGIFILRLSSFLEVVQYGNSMTTALSQKVNNTLPLTGKQPRKTEHQNLSISDGIIYINNAPTV
jgi:hypothetical protein